MVASWTSLEIAKLAASLVSPIVTIIGFWFIWQQLKNTNQQIEIAGDGLDASNRQNKINQDWKRAEFVASEIKEFYKDPTVVKVLQMIDYNDRKYDIGMKDKNGKPRLTRVTHSEAATLELKEKWAAAIEAALRTSDEYTEEEATIRLKEKSAVAIEAALRTSDEYTDEEATIRDYFDTLLYYIERFERFLKIQLITEEEIFPYLRYFIRIFRGELDHVDTGMLESFQMYLRDFHFEDAEEFFYRRFSEVNSEIGQHRWEEREGQAYPA